VGGAIEAVRFWHTGPPCDIDVSQCDIGPPPLVSTLTVGTTTDPSPILGGRT
jgi:hypothetical protein